LLALILAASAAPADISAASAYLIQYGDMTRIDSQHWDPSVRALAHYPAVISWMAENIEWTRALGLAFLSSPAEVMASIQRLRARALAAGALASTPQQRVVVQDNSIEILPAEPDWIYAPSYDTGVVYSEEPYFGYGGPFMSFGPALEAGPWLSYGFDWIGCSVWVGGWSAWHGPGGWHHPHFDGGHAPPGVHRWHPPTRRPGELPSGPENRGNSAPPPHPLSRAPNPPPSHSGKSGALESAMPVPRTAAPPLERPRLGTTTEPAGKEPHAADTEPRSARSGGASEIRGGSQAQESAQAQGAARPAASASAPRAAPSHESAPAASHQSAPASAPAPSPAADAKNH
jgi:hypothetical protein